MTIAKNCAVCKGADRRRLIELVWNDGMTASAIATALGDVFSSATILKHLKQHADGDANARAVAPLTTGTVRERVEALQEMQLNEVERQIALAKERAAQLNAHIDRMREAGAEGADDIPYHDWSEFFNILHKDNQAAISSILKAQGLKDKREKAVADTKLGLFEAMSKSGLAPKAISGPVPVPQLTSGEDDDDAD